MYVVCRLAFSQTIAGVVKISSRIEHKHAHLIMEDLKKRTQLNWFPKTRERGRERDRGICRNWIEPTVREDRLILSMALVLHDDKTVNGRR